MALTITSGYVTSDRRDVDPHERLQADRGVEVYFIQGFVHTYIHWYTGHDRSLKILLTTQ